MSYSSSAVVGVTALVRSALCFAAFAICCPHGILAGELMAGAAKVDITDRTAGPVNDPLYVKAIVLKSNATTAVLVSVDAVAIGEIGRISNDYLPDVRSRLEKELGIPPSNVVVSASHCHGVICADVAERTFRAVKQARQNLVPVTVGVGTAKDDRVMENRRLKLKNGVTVDVRHAYSLPPDDDVAQVGPVDPEIGILRLDRENGQTLAVVYNFACHPIQGVPGGANTADITGFASQVIEDNLSNGAIALFLQGCCGDINPAYYKDVDHPRSAEPLGNMLGLSTLRGVRDISCREDNRLAVLNETLTLPRGDKSQRIVEMESEQDRLLQSLQGTSLNLKSFIPLVVKYNLSNEFPSYYSYRYLQGDALGQEELRQLDTENRRNIQAYIQNIYIMEQLTRVKTNLALLRKHQAEFEASTTKTIDVEIVALRIGDFILLTFPGELTVPIGFDLKRRAPCQPTFVAGYTNGYIYYCPTAEQMRNAGHAQEDSDCLLAPQWQDQFMKKALEMLNRL